MPRNPFRQWGLWVNGQGDHAWDMPFLLDHVRKIKPPTMTVANDFGRAFQFWEAGEGETDVIIRMVAPAGPDKNVEENWRGWWAQDWVNLLKHWKVTYGDRATKLRWQIFNEPAMDDNTPYDVQVVELVKRLIFILQESRKIGMKVSLAGWASASIPYEAIFDRGLFDSLLRVMAETDEPIVGHDYMLHPNTDIALGRPGGFTPNDVLDPERMKPGNWPTKAQVQKHWQTNFLGFRTGWLSERGKQLGLNLGVISQEGPFDKMPNLDADPWNIYQRIRERYGISPAPYTDFKGVMSYAHLWEKLHPEIMNKPNGHQLMTLAFMGYLAEVAPDYYIGHTLWCVNHNKDDWDNQFGMSVSRLGREFFEMWQDKAKEWDALNQPAPAPEPTPEPTPIPAPPPQPGKSCSLTVRDIHAIISGLKLQSSALQMQISVWTKILESVTE